MPFALNVSHRVSSTWLFSTPRWLERLQRNAAWFERLFGLVLLGLAGRLVFETLV
jgi:threonine/homoserine/homoserine lactone efflux protein